MRGCCGILLERVGDPGEDTELKRLEVYQVIAAYGVHVLFDPRFNRQHQPVSKIVAKLETRRSGIDHIPEVIRTAL